MLLVMVGVNHCTDAKSTHGIPNPVQQIFGNDSPPNTGLTPGILGIPQPANQPATPPRPGPPPNRPLPPIPAGNTRGRGH